MEVAGFVDMFWRHCQAIDLEFTLVIGLQWGIRKTNGHRFGAKMIMFCICVCTPPSYQVCSWKCNFFLGVLVSPVGKFRIIGTDSKLPCFERNDRKPTITKMSVLVCPSILGSSGRSLWSACIKSVCEACCDEWCSDTMDMVGAASPSISSSKLAHETGTASVAWLTGTGVAPSSAISNTLSQHGSAWLFCGSEGAELNMLLLGVLSSDWSLQKQGCPVLVLQHKNLPLVLPYICSNCTWQVCGKHTLPVIEADVCQNFYHKSWSVYCKKNLQIVTASPSLPWPTFSMCLCINHSHIQELLHRNGKVPWWNQTE